MRNVYENIVGNLKLGMLKFRCYVYKLKVNFVARSSMKNGLIFLGRE